MQLTELPLPPAARYNRCMIETLLPLAPEPSGTIPAPDQLSLRPAVLWRKGSFGSDSEEGSRFAERLLTVVATCRQQGRLLVNFLVAAGTRYSEEPRRHRCFI